MKNWIAYIAVIAGFAVYHAATEADRDATGAIVDGGHVDAFKIRVGDCFDDSSSEAGSELVSDLPGVPCAEPHDNEVFAIFDVDVEKFPGDQQMAQVAFDACRERFATFAGIDYDSSTLDIMTLHPSVNSWQHQNDREVVCAVYDMETKKLTGSVKGLAL